MVLGGARTRTEGEHVEGALPVALAARAPRVLEGALRLRGAVARLVPALHAHEQLICSLNIVSRAASHSPDPSQPSFACPTKH